MDETYANAALGCINWRDYGKKGFLKWKPRASETKSVVTSQKFVYENLIFDYGCIWKKLVSFLDIDIQCAFCVRFRFLKILGFNSLITEFPTQQNQWIAEQVIGLVSIWLRTSVMKKFKSIKIIISEESYAGSFFKNSSIGFFRNCCDFLSCIWKGQTSAYPSIM